MRKFIFFIFTLASFFCSWAQPNENSNISFSEYDRQIFEDLHNSLSAKKDLPVNKLMIEIGKYFLYKPYVAKTLEINDSEKLVINLREFDCTTFIENCLALAQTFKSKRPNFTTFTNSLKNIRYRNGICNDYASRLHYFSEWLLNNEQKSNIKLDAINSNTPYPNKLNFMSSHTDSYKALKNNTDFVTKIKATEQQVSQSTINYIPKDKLSQYLYLLNDGDIIGITTNIKGLDVLHTVLVFHQNKKVHMLHASSAAKKIIFSEETLLEYLNASKIRTGILVGRAQNL